MSMAFLKTRMLQIRSTNNLTACQNNGGGRFVIGILARYAIKKVTKVMAEIAVGKVLLE